MIRFTRALFVLSILLLGMVACQRVSAPTAEPIKVTVEVTREVVATVNVPVEVTREVFVPVTVMPAPLVSGDVVELPTAVATVGSAENPLQLVFTPTYGEAVIRLRGQALADALSAESGLNFEVVIPSSITTTIDTVCASPTTTIAFLTSFEFILANRQCGLQISHAGVRDGIPWKASMVVVRSPATVEDRINGLQDLAGKSWAVSSTNDLTNYLYYRALFSSLGIETGAVTEYGSDASAVIATFDEREDFVTATYLPPLLPYQERQWVYGVDDPEIWRDAGEMPRRSGIGYAIVDEYVKDGGYQVRDARAIILDTRPTIFVYTVLVDVGAQMPNDAVAFGTAVELGLSRQLSALLANHTQSEACSMTLCSSDFFNWEGIIPVADTFYDPVRFVIDELALTDEQVFNYLNEQQ